MLFIILPRYATDIDDDIHSFLHRLYADKLVWTMEVDAAGEDIRTRKSTEAELGAISAATNRLHLWSDTTFLHGPEHYVDDVHLWLNLLLHIIVLVFDLYRRCAVAIFLVDLVNTFGYKTFTCLEALTVVVADDIAERGEFGVGVHTDEMEEALIALGSLWCLVGRQHGSEFYSKTVGIDHLSLGISWMYAHSMYLHLSRGGVEVLILQFAHIAAVHSISPLAAELLHVEMMCSHANLLVGVERDADVAMGYLLMVAQIAHRLYYLGDTCLIVGAEEGVSVSDDEILAYMVEQFGEFLR